MTAALAVIAVVLSHFVGVMTLTFLALASVALTLPMMGGSFRGAVLAYVASAGISFLIVGYISLMPFVILFGPYPLLDYLLRKYLKKRFIVLPIEIAFADLGFLACYYAIGLTLSDFPIVDSLSTAGKWAVIFLLLTAVFVVFHFAFTALYDMLERRLSRVLKK